MKGHFSKLAFISAQVFPIFSFVLWTPLKMQNDKNNVIKDKQKDLPPNAFKHPYDAMEKHAGGGGNNIRNEKSEV